MKLFPKYGWRITKYNPIFRNEKGEFLKDEWISFFDVGKSFEDKILTLEEYLKAEDAYVSTALFFLRESGIESLEVSYLEKRNSHKTEKRFTADVFYNPKSVRKGMLVSGKVLENICRLVLREIIWCRLELEANFYIHFGYDYYMYVGSNNRSNEAIEHGRKNSLFIEKILSPYLLTSKSES